MSHQVEKTRHLVIEMHRAMLAAAHDYHRRRGGSVAEWKKALSSEAGVKDVHDELKSKRHSRKPPVIRNKWLMQREAEKIRGEISHFFRSNRYGVHIDVGPEHRADYQKKSYKTSSSLYVEVGHMWHRKIWENFYKDKNIGTDLFIYDADELRVNIPNIRLFTASIFHKDNKEKFKGYIGQSKIGKRLAEFHRTKQAAIDYAIKQVTRDLDQALKGETE